MEIKNFWVRSAAISLICLQLTNRHLIDAQAIVFGSKKLASFSSLASKFRIAVEPYVK